MKNHYKMRAKVWLYPKYGRLAFCDVAKKNNHRRKGVRSIYDTVIPCPARYASMLEILSTMYSTVPRLD